MKNISYSVILILIIYFWIDVTRWKEYKKEEKENKGENKKKK